VLLDALVGLGDIQGENERKGRGRLKIGVLAGLAEMRGLKCIIKNVSFNADECCADVIILF